MIQFVTRPIEKWPRPETKRRTNGGYSTNYGRTLQALQRELAHLGAKDIAIIQVDLPDSLIRLDGLPYAGQRPRTPRVALAFTGKYGPMTYYCDAHFVYEANVRAICLGLERLRLVERTGIISRGEQYTGFRALPPGIAMGPATMSLDDAARFITKESDEALTESVVATSAAATINDVEKFKFLYRKAALRLHPDKAPDRGDDWKKFQEATAVLNKHHGIA